MTLSLANLSDFFTRGFILIPNFFDAQEIQVVSEAFDRLYQTAKKLNETTIMQGTQFVIEKNRLQRIVWCEGMEPGLATISTHPKVTSIVSNLLASVEIIQLLSQAHYKNPGDLVEFKWHQDSVHRRAGTELWSDVNGKGSFVQTLMLVDHMGKSNGALKVLEGSLELGHLSEKSPEELEKMSRFFKEVEIHGEAGTMLFFHPYLIHSSLSNHSQKSRRVFINGYASPGANRRVYPGSGLGKVITSLHE
jgi:ectoine hydroxylase-related dioxygenase (phytanoyl-CoA dioxygenase family)